MFKLIMGLFAIVLLFGEENFKFTAISLTVFVITDALFDIFIDKKKSQFFKKKERDEIIIVNNEYSR